jgi:hypothetical protein
MRFEIKHEYFDAEWIGASTDGRNHFKAQGAVLSNGAIIVETPFEFSIPQELRPWPPLVFIMPATVSSQRSKTQL